MKNAFYLYCHKDVNILNINKFILNIFNIQLADISFINFKRKMKIKIKIQMQMKAKMKIKNENNNKNENENQKLKRKQK